MYVLPRTRRGRLALWLLLPVLLYPFYWSVLLLVPDTWRAVSIGFVVVLAGLVVVSLTVAGLALLRDRERSVLLIAVASLTALTVLTLVVGEAVGGH
jgi:hypothetical protein